MKSYKDHCDLLDGTNNIWESCVHIIKNHRLKDRYLGLKNQYRFIKWEWI